MNYIFPVAIMANMFCLIAMLALFRVANQSHMAADIGIVQVPTSDFFYALLEQR